MAFELGKGYDELEIGDSASFSKTITETDVYLFAGISGDFNPVHVNEEFAKQTPFGTRVAHGALPQSLIAPVLGMKLPGLGTVAVEVQCRYKAPTFFGDTITATATVAEKIEKKKWIRMSLLWTNQRGEKVAEGEAVVIPPPKQQLSAASEMDSSTGKEARCMAFTDVKEIFAGMPGAFNPSGATGVDAVFQYEISGEGGGDWHVIIKDGTCQVNEGKHDSPSVTLAMSAETWLGIVNKEVNAIQAFMGGQLKATGDIMLAQRFEQMFSL